MKSENPAGSGRSGNEKSRSAYRIFPIAKRRLVGESSGVDGWLTSIQENLGGVPAWLLLAGVGVALLLLAWMAAKLLRFALAVTAVAVIAGACIVAYQHLFP